MKHVKLDALEPFLNPDAIRRGVRIARLLEQIEMYGYDIDLPDHLKNVLWQVYVGMGDFAQWVYLKYEDIPEFERRVFTSRSILRMLHDEAFYIVRPATVEVDGFDFDWGELKLYYAVHSWQSVSLHQNMILDNVERTLTLNMYAEDPKSPILVYLSSKSQNLIVSVNGVRVGVPRRYIQPEQMVQLDPALHERYKSQLMKLRDSAMNPDDAAKKILRLIG